MSLISDHYHPWISTQGQSPFVWAVIGGIAHATQKLRLGTGVTCPTVRIHPAIIAQAAATAAELAGRTSDGLISTAPKEGIIDQFRQAGGEGRPAYGQVKVCWAQGLSKAEDIVCQWWPTLPIPGLLHADLPTPDHFESVLKPVTRENAVWRIASFSKKRSKPIQALSRVAKSLALGQVHQDVERRGADEVGELADAKQQRPQGLVWAIRWPTFGSRMVNRAPPAGLFSAHTRPPCAWTMACTIANPSPLPL